MKTTLGSNIAVQEGGYDQLDCLLCGGDHQQDSLLEGVQPGLLVGDEQLEGDCLVDDGQLRGNPVFSSCKIIA